MARRIGIGLGLALLAGCGRHSTPPVAEPPRAEERAPSPQQIAGTPFRVGDYFPSELAIQSSSALLPDSPDGLGGILANGVRVAPDGSVGEDLAEPALGGGARLPAHLGGGFLFWNATTLYRSSTITGALEPVTELPSGPGIFRVRFGPDFALLLFNDGSRLALDPKTRTRATYPVPGLIDVATLGDGRSVLLADPNRVLVRRGHGQPYEDRTAVVPGVTELRASFDSIELLSRGEGVFHLEPDGSLSRTAGPPTPPTATLDDAPGGLLVTSGVPLPDGRGLVPVRGAFRTLDPRTGATVMESEPVLASTDRCSLLPTGSDVLALCWTSAGASVVVAGAASPTPRIERSFDGRVTFFAGESGTLAKDGPCAGPYDPDPVTVCVRDRAGAWRDFDVFSAEALARMPENDGKGLRSRILRWIPTANGAAIGIVGGERSGLLFAKERRFRRFVHPKGFRDVLFRVDDRPLLDDRFTVLEDGTLVGYARRGVREGRGVVANVALRSDGSVKTGPIRLDAVQHAGPLALGVEGGRLWQSVDFGQHWRPVASPPGFARSGLASPTVCSRAGCALGAWYRIGFPETPPHAETSTVAGRGSSPVPPPAAQLLCRSLGAPRARAVTPTYDDEGSLLEVPELGARLLRVREGAEPNIAEFRALIGGVEAVAATNTTPSRLLDPGDPGYAAALRTPSPVLFRPLFGPPNVLTARLTWSEVFRITEAAHLAFEPEILGGGGALPILSSRAGESAGLLLTQPGWTAWLTEGRPTRSFALGLLNDSANPVGAAAVGDDTLWVLVEDDAKRARLLELKATGARILAELPRRPSLPSNVANADFLAVGRRGDPWVLRIPAFEPPTADDPALLLAPGKPPLPLAPWSTLGAGSACATDPDAVRAIVLLRPRWVTVRVPGSAGEPAAALGMVRWGQERVCLEALEVPLDVVQLGDDEAQLFLSARLEGAPTAHRYALGLGTEYVEPLACRLEAAP